MEPSNNEKKGFNRRDFLKTGALSGLFLGSAGLTACANGTNERQRDRDYRGKAKYVIFMVSDGMSHGTIQLADLMRRRQEGRPSTWIRLYEENKVKRGLMDMTTGNSNVPDSAAAASSWGCGLRITNGRLNMGDNEEMYEPLVPIFKEAGKKTALVTTTEVTHATPAGFAANVMERGMQDEIAQQYLEREPDIILGGGNRHFHAEHREDARDLYSKFGEKGYDVVRKKSDLMNLGSDFSRVLGVFTDSHLPYTLDHLNTPDLKETVPTLAEMTKFSLDKLYASGDGFIIQIEGGRVDHAAHTLDAPGLIYDQIAFDDAVEEAFKFYEQHPDETLLIFTTDHGNANPGLNAHGPRYNDSVPNFDTIQNYKHTNNWILSELRNSNPSISRIREVIEYSHKTEITRDQADYLRKAMAGEFTAAYTMRGRDSAVLCDIMSNYNNVAFLGSVHTADYVELAAVGPGSETLGNFTINTDLFKLVTEAAGIEVEVPA